MPFQSRGLGPYLVAQLDAFIAANDIAVLYTAYAWDADTHAAGFPNILALEIQLSGADRAAGIGMTDVMAVAAWGRLRNPGRVQGPDVVLPPNFLTRPNGDPQPNLAANPLPPLRTVEGAMHGIGPTYTSKVLRFGCPQEFGAIDTRCVRVFGQGDPANQIQCWFPVAAINSGSGWYIPSQQANWPDGYAVWLNILRHIAHRLNAAAGACPHPPGFIGAGLRSAGLWTCADVEMALFTYASNVLP